MKQEWIKFKTETNLEGAYKKDANGNLVDVKMISKVPSGFFYSCFNEVSLKAEELCVKK